MKKKLHRSTEARKIKMNARAIRRDFPAERGVTTIPAGTIVGWVGRRNDDLGVNVDWNSATYAISKNDWDGAVDVEEPGDDDA